LPGHLAGPDGFNQIRATDGTHNLQNATTALDSQSATYTLTPTSTNGISELQYGYTNATGRQIVGNKTVYGYQQYTATKQYWINSQTAGQRGLRRYLQDTSQTRFDNKSRWRKFPHLILISIQKPARLMSAIYTQ